MSEHRLEVARTRLNAMATDRNVDVEDVELCLSLLWTDGALDVEEHGVLRRALSDLQEVLEPAARRYLEDRLAGRARALVSRVLLGPLPPGTPPDLYQARNDVVRLQDALGVLGHALVTDGLYGRGTSRAVVELQRAAGLHPTGLLDTATLGVLNARLVELGRPALDLTPRARIRPDEVLAMRHGRNIDDNRLVQASLARLGAAWGDASLAIPADGAFGARTEAAVRVVQRRRYLPETGIVDRATWEAVRAELAAIGEPTPELSGRVAGDAAPELHFYPGDPELKVYVLRGGKLLGTYGMVGGAAVGRDDPGSNVDYSASPEGRYDVIEISPHASWSWSYSYVPWGADLREVDGEVEYRDGAGRWRVATGPRSVFLGRNPPPLTRSEFLDEDGKLPPTWRYNDFGHLRGRLRSQRSGQVQTHMIHSSPDQEETANYFADTGALLEPTEALRRLRHSHGCEHIHPRDLDDLVARGWLRPGTLFVIHGYDERFGGA